MKVNALGYYELGHAEVSAVLRSILSPKGKMLVEAAYELSKGGHKNQFRANKTIRYFEHPKSVFLILALELKECSWRRLVLALIHDVREDSYLLNSFMVERLFGKKVARSLELLTKDPKVGYHDRLMAFGKIRDLVVKLCDRLHNLRTLAAMPKEKWRKQILETREEYIPMAEKLWQMLPCDRKWQAEYLKEKISALCDSYEAGIE